MNELKGIVRMSPRIILFGGLLGYLTTSDLIALRFTIYFILTEILVLVTKMMFGKTNPRYQRPEGAGYGKGCGVIAKDCDADAPESDVRYRGMPSGHSTTVTMAFAFWTWKMWLDKDTSRISKTVRTGILGVMTILVLMSRSSEHCNSSLQILAGSIFGLLLGSAFFSLDLLIQNKMQKKL